MNRFFNLKKLGLVSSSFFFILVIAGFSFIESKSSDRSEIKIEVHEEVEKDLLSLEQRLLNLLHLFIKAHESLIEKNQDQLLAHGEDILNQISKIDISQEDSMNYHEKLYLYRQLQNINENIRFMTLRNISENQKMTNLKQAYRELISISQSYALNQKSSDEWSVYFCSKNSSLWVQNSNLKKHNPFGQDQNCGQRVY